MTSDIRSLATDAYVFTYPLVMNYRTMYMQAIKGDGRFGKWRHLGLSTPTDFDIVTPNNDTPYSYAWLDLRAEPWVLTIPKIEPKRFYTAGGRQAARLKDFANCHDELTKNPELRDVADNALRLLEEGQTA